MISAPPYVSPLSTRGDDEPAVPVAHGRVHPAPRCSSRCEQENFLGPRRAPPEYRNRLPAGMTVPGRVRRLVDRHEVPAAGSSTHHEWAYIAPGTVTAASPDSEPFAAAARFGPYVKGLAVTHVGDDEVAQPGDAQQV